MRTAAATSVWVPRCVCLYPPSPACGGALPQEIESSEDPNLRKAQRIVHNIRKRRLYRFADEYILPRGLAERLKKVGGWAAHCCHVGGSEWAQRATIATDSRANDADQVTAADISSCNVTSSVQLRPEHIMVHDMKLNYTNKVRGLMFMWYQGPCSRRVVVVTPQDKDPMENVRFFRDWEDTGKDHAMHLTPGNHSHHSVAMLTWHTHRVLPDQERHCLLPLAHPVRGAHPPCLQQERQH